MIIILFEKQITTLWKTDDYYTLWKTDDRYTLLKT